MCILVRNLSLITQGYVPSQRTDPKIEVVILGLDNMLQRMDCVVYLEKAGIAHGNLCMWWSGKRSGGVVPFL